MFQLCFLVSALCCFKINNFHSNTSSRNASSRSEIVFKWISNIKSLETLIVRCLFRIINKSSKCSKSQKTIFEANLMTKQFLYNLDCECSAIGMESRSGLRNCLCKSRYSGATCSECAAGNYKYGSYCLSNNTFH